MKYRFKMKIKPNMVGMRNNAKQIFYFHFADRTTMLKGTKRPIPILFIIDSSDSED